jgi:benzoyl-CoA 2,3-dioxygenase component B
MLTEEAHHLFVGETGIRRIVQRTAELMREAPGEDVREVGGIPLDILQKYLNEWYSASLDLFGGEDSSNAASYFASGLKGRYKEGSSKRYDDHLALEGIYPVDVPTANGGMTVEEVPLRRAMNLVLRDAYRDDCERALAMWNKTLAQAGHSETLYLPHERFNRGMGLYMNYPFDVHGELLSQEKFDQRVDQWLPTDEDRVYVQGLMQPIYEPGKMANWIAPPKRGINGQSMDFEYVRFA